MATFQWYPFFPGDYARDTAHLSDTEDLFYRRLLDYYYSTGEPLPLNDERLQRVCRAFTPEAQKAVSFILSEFFEVRGEVYHNDKADRVIAKAAEVSEKRADAARKSHERRANADKKPANADKPENTGKHAIAENNHAIAEKNHAKGYAKIVHPQPQPQEDLKPHTYIGIEKLVRDCVTERRQFIRDRFGFNDNEIEIEIEEILVKCNQRSPGPDVWLFISRWFKNRREEINVKGRGRTEKDGTRSHIGTNTGNNGTGGDLEFVDNSDKW